MDENERLTKAHQTAQLLLSDLREVYSKADTVAVEELMMPAIEQVSNLSRLLGRLAKQA
jgi:hypothetical protein